MEFEPRIVALSITSEALDRTYAVMSRRNYSGEINIAERHNEQI